MELHPDCAKIIQRKIRLNTCRDPESDQCESELRPGMLSGGGQTVTSHFVHSIHWVPVPCWLFTFPELWGFMYRLPLALATFPPCRNPCSCLSRNWCLVAAPTRFRAAFYCIIKPHTHMERLRPLGKSLDLRLLRHWQIISLQVKDRQTGGWAFIHSF